MINHIHLIAESCDVSGFVRDFKRHTSREIHKNIIATKPNIEKLFIETDGTYSIWQDTNMPIVLESKKVFQQKLNYILENPVRKNYVSEGSFWYWSSVNENCELKIDEVEE